MTVFAAAFRQEAARIAHTRADLLLLTIMPLVLLGSMTAMLWRGTLRDLPVVIVDQDGGPLAREIGRNIAAIDQLEVVAKTPDPEVALAMVRSEKAVAYIVIPRGIGGPPSKDGPVRIFYEAVFLSTGSLASTYLRVIAGLTLAEQVPRNLGVRGVPEAARALPTAQITVLGNPTLSLEWYLGMLIGPSVLHLLIAISCIGSLGVLLQGGSFGAFVRTTRSPGTYLAGRLSLHVVIGTLWGLGWLLWMTLARGYRVEGSLAVIVLGMILLFLATAGLALLFMAVTREVGTSLSAAVIVAGSALAYSGATLPLSGGRWYARDWSQVLPLTHYILLQMDAMIDATTAATIQPATVLVLYPLIAGAIGMVLILRSGKRA